jgi:lysophospholipase L1-like esterase
MMNRIFVLLSALLLTVPSFADQETQAKKPYLMISMGDSITAATFADIPIPLKPELEERVQEWTENALKPELIFENKASLSWSSGKRIRSHYTLLKESLRRHGDKRRVDVLNVAMPGDETKDLYRQTIDVLREWQEGKYAAVKYITILIGANDACSSRFPDATPLETMRKHLLETFRLLSSITNPEPVRILLVGMPRIPDLGSEYMNNRKTLFGATCAKVRNKILKYCSSLTIWNTPAEYDARMKIVEDRNRLYQSVAREANTLYRNIQVVYSNRLYNLEIPPEILAADCFHPAKKGQIRISEETWLDQPWYK